MKSSQGITADVNICFINYEMIKTHVIKTNYWWGSLNQIAFIKWMHIISMLYLSIFRESIILRFVRFFLIFFLIINRDSHVVVFVSTNEKRLQNQVYKQIKSGKSSPLERIEFSLYRFLSSFSKSKNILTLPKLLSSLKLGLIRHNWRLHVCRVFCLPDLHACALLVYRIKTNASCLLCNFP